MATAGNLASVQRARNLARAVAVLVVLTTGLIVLGALVRAHGAGLACPDWPLCFGQVIPEIDLKVGFEFGHRVAAGAISLLFLGVGILLFRDPALRASLGRAYAIAAAVLLVQILLGALTVWELLARWTVTSHLVTGNTFNACLLVLALGLSDRATPKTRPPLPAATRVVWMAALAVLVLQFVLGGLVSSGYAGLVCPEWPTCLQGAWFPTWEGPIGIHLAHRMNGYLLTALLAACAVASFREPRLRLLGGVALLTVLAQVVVGIANVLLELPVEVTGLHSALAALLVLIVVASVRESWVAPRA